MGHCSTEDFSWSRLWSLAACPQDSWPPFDLLAHQRRLTPFSPALLTLCHSYDRAARPPLGASAPVPPNTHLKGFCFCKSWSLISYPNATPSLGTPLSTPAPCPMLPQYSRSFYTSRNITDFVHLASGVARKLSQQGAHLLYYRHALSKMTHRTW